MSTEHSEDDSQGTKPTVTSVAKSVLVRFFDELAKTEGFVDVAPKLRKVVLDDAIFAEPAIRAAMFSDTP